MSIHSRAFPLYRFVFQTCLCRTWLSRNLIYIKVVFHSRKLVFRFFTTTCVEVNFVLVKKLNNHIETDFVFTKLLSQFNNYFIHVLWHIINDVLIILFPVYKDLYCFSFAVLQSYIQAHFELL